MKYCCGDQTLPKYFNINLQVVLASFKALLVGCFFVIVYLLLYCLFKFVAVVLRISTSFHLGCTNVFHSANKNNKPITVQSSRVT